MKYAFIFLIGITLSGCAMLSDQTSQNLSGSHVHMEQTHPDGAKAELTYHNPKEVKGPFQGKATMKYNAKTDTFDMEVSGGADGGTKLDLSQAVEHTRAQMEAMQETMKTMADLARKFPGMVP